jgi:excisionase family DNA binding protein
MTRRNARSPMESSVNSQLKTVEQTATELNVSVHTIRAWIAQRRIASVRLGRAVRIPSAEIVRLIERGTIPAVDDRGRSVM